MEEKQEVKEVVEEKKGPTAEELLKNREAELARKNEELQRLKAEREELLKPKRDPQDIRTWTDQELKMLAKSPDANLAQYREQAEELILERKVAAIRAKEREQERREQVTQTLTEKYPDASNPDSEFSQKMNRVMQEYDLAKTPAGRLAAARIVAAESKASTKSAEQIEADRVAALKANMVDGDRPRPTQQKNPNDSKALKDKLLSEKDTSHEAMGEWVDSVGLREKFNKVWGR